MLLPAGCQRQGGTTPSSEGGANGKAVLPSLRGGPTGWRAMQRATGERSGSSSACGAASLRGSSLLPVQAVRAPCVEPIYRPVTERPKSKTLLKGREEITPESHAYSAKLEKSENGKLNLDPNLVPLRWKESSVAGSDSSQLAPA